MLHGSGGEPKDRLRLFFFQVQTKEQVQARFQAPHSWPNRDHQPVCRERLLFLYPASALGVFTSRAPSSRQASAEGPGSSPRLRGPMASALTVCVVVRLRGERGFRGKLAADATACDVQPGDLTWFS